MNNVLQNKFVRLSLRIAIAIVGLIVILLTIVSVYVHFNKEKIISKIQQQVKNGVRGEVQISDIDIAVWSSFPYVAAKFNNVSLLDSQYHKPLIKASEISCSFNMFQLLRGSVHSIAKVEMYDGMFHLFTNSSAYTNAYLLSKKNTTSSNTSSSSIIINNIRLHKVHALIEHAGKNKRYEFNFASLNAKINKDDSLIKVNLEQDCFVKGLGFNLAKGIFLQNQTVNTNNCHIKFKIATKELTFTKTTFEINNHDYFVQGKFHFKDSAFFQLHVQTKDVLYQKASQVLPERIQKKLAMIDVKQPLNVVADIEGPLAYQADPFINAYWEVKSNEVTTPVIAFGKCNFTGKYTNFINHSLPQSDENSIIVINDFSGDWNGIKVNTDSILITNLANPRIRFTFLSQCSLTELNENLALNTLQFLSGTAKLAFQYDGALIADASMLTKLHAKLLLKDGSVLYQPRNLQFNNCNGDISFAENELIISKLQCDVKENHFEVKAQGTNLSRLAGTDSGRAFVAFDVASPSVNLNDFTSLLAHKKTSTVKKRKKAGLAYTVSSVDEWLDKGNLQFKIRAGHVVYNHFTADNVVGTFLFSQDAWEIQQATLQHAGGRFNLTAKINETNTNYHQANTILVLNNVDVRKVFYAFDNFGQAGISYNNLRGTMNTNAHLQLSLNNNGNIVSKSMHGKVNFSIRNGALINFKPLEDINEIIFKNRDLSNIQFAELKDSLIVKNGLVQINRMEIASTALHMFVQGIYDFNKTNTDISIQIPFSNLRKQKEKIKPENKGVNAKVGSSIYLRAKSDKDGKIKIGLDLLRKLRKNPTLK